MNYRTVFSFFFRTFRKLSGILRLLIVSADCAHAMEHGTQLTQSRKEALREDAPGEGQRPRYEKATQFTHQHA